MDTRLVREVIPMIDLLDRFELKDIIIFMALAAVAFQTISTFGEWLRTKIFKFVDKEQKVDNLAADSMKKISEIVEVQKKIGVKLDEMDESIQLLIRSDRDDIKAFITTQYHLFVEDKGWIDDFSLECLEKRYGHYRQEGGNSFVEDMMIKLRNLPRSKP